MPASLLDAARAAALIARQGAEASETARRLDQAVVEALVAAGLMRLCVPAVYGGPEVDPVTLVDVLATVAEGDGAAGWCAAIASTTSSMALFLEPAAAKEIYGDPAVVTGGAYAPSGRGERSDGRWRVTGRWMWGSGTSHCQWITGGTLCADGTFRLCFFPASSVTRHDTWFASGLRGTGSGDFSVEGVLVDDAHTVQPLAPRPAVDSALARFPTFGLLAAGIAATTLGMARRAIDEVVTLAGAKTPTLTTRTLAQSTLAQLDIARAEAALGGARAFLRDELATAWAIVQAGDPVPVEQRARVRLAVSHAVQHAAGAVDLAYGVGGGTSVFDSSPLQRCFRDVHTATQHLMVTSRWYETYGRLRLGQAIDDSTL